MAKPGGSERPVIIEGEWSARDTPPRPPRIRYDWRQNPEPWTPPSPEEYAGLFRIVGGLAIAGAIGAFRAWWHLHH